MWKSEGEGGGGIFAIEVLTSLSVIPQGNSSVYISRANRIDWRSFVVSSWCLLHKRQYCRNISTHHSCMDSIARYHCANRTVPKLPHFARLGQMSGNSSGCSGCHSNDSKKVRFRQSSRSRNVY